MTRGLNRLPELADFEADIDDFPSADDFSGEDRPSQECINAARLIAAAWQHSRLDGEHFAAWLRLIADDIAAHSRSGPH